MTGAIAPQEARRIVEARLGRQPQDMLEAAVALEAWAGVPAQRALETAREVMRDASPVPEPSTGALPQPVEQRGGVIEALTFPLTVIAIAGWAAPLADRAGTAAVELGILVALPLTLALQWGISCRWLSREHGPALLGRHRLVLMLMALVLVGGGALALGTAGLIAGLLVVTWVAGTVLVRCRLTLAYAGGVALATAGMLLVPDPVVLLAVVAAAAALAALLALRPPPVPTPGTTGRVDRVAAAAAIGAGTGLLLIGDPTVGWTGDAVPAIGLLPAAAAGFWASYRMRDVGYAVARATSGVRVGAAAPRGLASPPLRALLVALAGLAAIAAVLSAVPLLLTSWLGTPADAAGVLAGFGLLAAVTLLAGVLEALGRAAAVLPVLAAALAAEAWVRWGGDAAFAGAGLVAGGLVATALLLPLAYLVLGRPARTLATTLWIT